MIGLPTLAAIMDAANLRTLHSFADLYGVIIGALALFTTVRCRSTILNILYHWCFIAIVLTLAWSWYYADARSWQPWPPHLVLILVIDITMTIRFLRGRLIMREERAKVDRWYGSKQRSLPSA